MKNKMTLILGGIILVLIVSGLIVTYKLFLENRSNNAYGNRLDGAPKITESTTKNVIDEMNDLDDIKEAKVTHDGLLIKFSLVTNDDTDVNNIKNKINEILKNLDEEVLASYDIQIILHYGEVATFGYLHKTSSNISWIKN